MAEPPPPDVVFVTFPAAGHALPLLAVADQLCLGLGGSGAGAGVAGEEDAELRVAVVTSASFVPFLSGKSASLRSGRALSELQFIGLDDGLVPENVDDKLGAPKGKRPIAHAVESMTPKLRELMKDWPRDPGGPLLVIDPLTIAGVIVATELNLRFCLYCSWPLEVAQLAGVVPPRDLGTWLRVARKRWGMVLPDLMRLLGIWRQLSGPDRLHRTLVQREARRRLVLLNACMGVEDPVQLPPNVRVVGRELQYAVEDLGDKLEGFADGHATVVVITFGSRLSPTERQVRTIYDTLVEKRALGEGVAFVWSLKERDEHKLPVAVADAPPHLLLSRWIPQAALLHHPNVKAVISHCGFGGLNDCCQAGKPLVCMPFINQSLDQPLNANVAVSRGFGVQVDPNSFTPAQLVAALRAVLEDPSHTAAAERARLALMSESHGPRAAREIEAAARYGTQHIEGGGLPRGRWRPPGLGAGLLVGAAVGVGAVAVLAALPRLLGCPPDAVLGGRVAIRRP